MRTHKMNSVEPSFDDLLHWAKHDPKRLDSYQKEKTQEIIDNAPNHIQRRLRGLQFQIDCQRELHRSAIGRCIQISKMMHDSLDEMVQIVNGHKKDLNTPATILMHPTISPLRLGQ